MDLNNEQKRALFLPPKGVVLVKGVAGSGKTTIAVARAFQLKKLIANESPLFSSGYIKIGVFTFNRTLKQYLDGLFSDSLADGKDLLGITITGIHSFIFQKHIKQLNTKVIYDSDFKKLIEKCLIKEQLTSNLLKKDLDFCCDEFKWFKGMMISSQDDYLKTRRKGREGRLSEDDKIALWKLYERVRNLQNEKQLITFDDYPNIAIKTVQPMFDAIIIDEAQDLSKACLTYLSRLVKKETNSIMILADAAQSIYTNGITWKDVGFYVHGSRSIELKQNYRNPVSLYKVASCIIDKVHDKDDFIKEGLEIARSKINEGAKKVNIVHCGSFEREYDELCKYVTEIHCDNSVSIGILVKTNSGKIEVNDFLSSKGFNVIDIDPKDKNAKLKINSSIYLSTMHSAKGLEFDFVIILDVNESLFVTEGDDYELCDKNRKLLYTGITRAKKNVYIFSSEKEYSKMLDDIDKDLLNIIDYRL